MKTKDAVLALSSLAQESRLRVFRLLVKVGPDGLAAGEIAKKLNVPAATLSFHLKELAHAGLVVSDKQGRSVIYAMNVKGINALMEFLTEDCCQGRPELCRSVECGSPPSKGLRQEKRTSRKVAKA